MSKLDQLRVDAHIVDVAGFVPGNRRTYDILYACHAKGGSAWVTVIDLGVDGRSFAL